MIFLVNSQYENERKETNEKSDGKNKGQYFCRLPALLLCALLLSACGSEIRRRPLLEIRERLLHLWRILVKPFSEPDASGRSTGRDILIRSSGNSFGANLGFQSRLDGTIEEIDSSSFRVSETFTEDLGEDGLLAVSPADPDPTAFIEVTYTEDTVFTICSSSDMGITSTTSEATAADLEKGRSMYATGTRNGSVFHAEEITIYHFD